MADGKKEFVRVMQLVTADIEGYYNPRLFLEGEIARMWERMIDEDMERRIIRAADLMPIDDQDTPSWKR